jgi:hypothetical protein
MQMEMTYQPTRTLADQIAEYAAELRGMDRLQLKAEAACFGSHFSNSRHAAECWRLVVEEITRRESHRATGGVQYTRNGHVKSAPVERLPDPTPFAHAMASLTRWHPQSCWDKVKDIPTLPGWTQRPHSGCCEEPPADKFLALEVSPKLPT